MKSFIAMLFPLIACLNQVGAIPIRVLAWDEDVAARKLSISSAKGVAEIVDMHPFSRTPPIQVTAGDSAPMLLAMDKLDADGKPAASPITLPPGMKSPLLLLLPDEKSPTGVRQLAIEDNAADFKWGTIRLINATGKKLVFKWDKKLAAVPATWTPTDVNPGGSSRRMGIELFLAEQPDPPLYSAVWEHREEFRKLVFVVPSEDARLGPVDFKTITEDKRVIQANQADQAKANGGTAQ